MDRVLDYRSDIAVAMRVAALRLRGQMEYRQSFWLQIIGNFVVNGIEVLVTWSLFQQFDSLGGWSLQEVLLLHGLSMTMFAIGDTISNGIQTIPELIREGGFDRHFVRPMSVYVQSIVNEVSLRHFGMLFQGLLLFAYAIASVSIDWSLAKVLFLAVVILSGAAFFVALFTVEAIISFWTVSSIEVVNAFTYGGSDFGQYPLHIFGRGLRFVFLWIIPIGFLVYYPSLYLLDRNDPLGFPRFTSFVSPVAALLFCFVVSRGWALALRHYSSTGS